MAGIEIRPLSAADETLSAFYFQVHCFFSLLFFFLFPITLTFRPLSFLLNALPCHSPSTDLFSCSVLFCVPLCCVLCRSSTPPRLFHQCISTDPTLFSHSTVPSFAFLVPLFPGFTSHSLFRSFSSVFLPPVHCPPSSPLPHSISPLTYDCYNLPFSLLRHVSSPS